MARDLTRHEIRELVRLGLEHTRGNYKLLVTTFNMPPEDYKKFLNFLRKYQCHVPFQRFRMAPADLHARGKFEASRLEPPGRTKGSVAEQSSPGTRHYAPTRSEATEFFGALRRSALADRSRATRATPAPARGPVARTASSLSSSDTRR